MLSSFIRYLTDKFLHYDQASLQLPLVFFTPSHSQLYFFFIMYCFVINNALNPASSFSIWLWSHPLEHEQAIIRKENGLPSLSSYQLSIAPLTRVGHLSLSLSMLKFWLASYWTSNHTCCGFLHVWNSQSNKKSIWLYIKYTTIKCRDTSEWKLLCYCLNAVNKQESHENSCI